MERGITSYGAYIPRLRIDRAAIAAAHKWAFPSLKGKGARALANWDEDTVTMAVEAARGVDLGGVSSIVFASTTPPYADLQNATLVASALALPADIASSDASGSLRAGTSALLNALHSNRAGDALVVASDARRAKPGSAQEMAYGAGAVALNIGTNKIIARLIGSATRAVQFVDHFRQTGQPYDYYWEERWVRDEGYGKILPPAIKAALSETNLQASDIDHFCLPAVLGGVAAAVAKRAGIRPEAVGDDLAANCGDTGAAHSLMMLAAALEKAIPGERIMVVTFGAGADVLVFEATDEITHYKAVKTVSSQVERGLVEPHYTKILSFHGEISLDWGMRGEGGEKIALTQQYREIDQLASFTAGKCPDFRSWPNASIAGRLPPSPRILWPMNPRRWRRLRLIPCNFPLPRRSISGWSISTMARGY
jgi:3-hydroxy-3-methylglutaryl CoA synthase